MLEIRRYTKEDEDALMAVIKAEGEEWSTYWGQRNESYRRLLTQSLTYVAFWDGVLCGYCRSLQDGDFYIYVCDLLVAPAYRGNSIGIAMMQKYYEEFPNHIVYVMSDVDEYYYKQGAKKEGSVLEVPRPM